MMDMTPYAAFFNNRDKYAVLDRDTGLAVGVKKNAPKEVKEAYRRYIADRKANPLVK